MKKFILFLAIYGFATLHMLEVNKLIYLGLLMFSPLYAIICGKLAKVIE